MIIQIISGQPRPPDAVAQSLVLAIGVKRMKHMYMLIICLH